MHSIIRPQYDISFILKVDSHTIYCSVNWELDRVKYQQHLQTTLIITLRRKLLCRERIDQKLYTTNPFQQSDLREEHQLSINIGHK